jgi:hypothetical protein
LYINGLTFMKYNFVYFFYSKVMSTIFAFLAISFWPLNLFQSFARLLLTSHLHMFISSFYIGCSFIWSFLLDHLLVHLLLSNLCTFPFYMFFLLFLNLQHNFCTLILFILVIDSHVLPTNVHTIFSTYFHLLDIFLLSLFVCILFHIFNFLFLAFVMCCSYKCSINLFPYNVLWRLDH